MELDQEIWQVPANTPAQQKLACRLAVAFDEFQAWAKARKVEHLVGAEIPVCFIRFIISKI